MFWFRRFFLHRTSKQLLCEWLLPASGPKKCQTDASSVINPRRLWENKKSRQTRTMPKAVHETRTFLNLFSFPATVIKEGKINYLHFLNILIECLNEKCQEFHHRAPFWYILRWFSAILTHRWIFWASLMQKVDAGGVFKVTLQAYENCFISFAVKYFTRASHEIFKIISSPCVLELLNIPSTKPSKRQHIDKIKLQSQP